MIAKQVAGHLAEIYTDLYAYIHNKLNADQADVVSDTRSGFGVFGIPRDEDPHVAGRGVHHEVCCSKSSSYKVRWY